MTKRILSNSFTTEIDKRARSSQEQAFAEDLEAIRSGSTVSTAQHDAEIDATRSSATSILPQPPQPPIQAERYFGLSSYPNSSTASTTSCSSLGRDDTTNDLGDNDDGVQNWLSGVVRRHPRVGASFQAITLPSAQPQVQQPSRSVRPNISLSPQAQP